MSVKRTQIRRYIQEMLSEQVDVGGRVFTGRPNSPLFTSELPAINIHFADEAAEVNVGSEYFVKEYLKKAEVIITIVVENQLQPYEDPFVTNRGEDFADFLGAQVENAFKDDWMLARRLDGYDADFNYHGLTHGSALKGTFAYDVETEGQTTCIGTVLRYGIPYDDDGTPDRRYPYFTEAGVWVYPGFVPAVTTLVDTLGNDVIDSNGNTVIASF